MNAATPAIAPVILNLDSPEDVFLASQTHRPVYWVSSRRPLALGGSPLVATEDFQGAWVENFCIIVQLPGQTAVCEAGSGQNLPTGELAARVLAQCLQSERPSAIQAGLHSAALVVYREHLCETNYE